MKKSLFQSALLHLVLIAIFFYLPLSVDLLKKGKATELTFGPPDATVQKLPTEEERKPIAESAPTPPEPKPNVTHQPVEMPTDVIPPVESQATSPMQKSANIKPESSPEIYGSLALNSYYYNKPMEAFPALTTTQSPAKKPQQQYILKPSMQGTVPMQKTSMAQTEAIPTITLSIIMDMPTEVIPVDRVPIAKQDYLQDIQQEIEKYKIYPEEAKEHNNDVGTVKVKFRIGKDGAIIKMEIIESSGSEILDVAGVALLKKIGKFQPIPDVLKKEFMDIILNVNYKVS